MKVLRFVANISYKDVCKLFSVLWVETAFEDVLNAVVQEFGIPHDEATERILCDLEGTSHTMHSFEEEVYRSISEGRVPKFRVITLGCEEDIEQQVPQETDFSGRASNLFSNMIRFEENLNKAENKFRLYRTEIESRIQNKLQATEPTHESNEPQIDVRALYRESEKLEIRKEKLDVFLQALLKFERSLKTREKILNRRENDLNELRKRLNSQEENIQSREYYSSYQSEVLLYGLSSSMDTTKQHLNEHAYALNPKEVMLHEEKNKIKNDRMIVKPKRKRCQMEVGSRNLDENEDETKFNEGASTLIQQRSRDLIERVLMELETEVSKQKRRRSASSEISDDQQAYLSGPYIPQVGEQVMWLDCYEVEVLTS